MTRARHDDGFTLAETLAALLVVSLSLACIVAATTQITHLNRKLAVERASDRRIETLAGGLAEQLHGLEPIMADDLNGTSAGFECVTSSCRFRAAPLHVSYAAEGHLFSAWPPDRAKDAAPVRLDAIILSDALGRTVAEVTLLNDEPKDCAFDLISRVCRPPAKAAS